MDKTQVVPLDGLWDFFYTPQKFEACCSLLPNKEKFTGRMVTPGYWDDNYDLFDEEDFFSLLARFNPDYRKPHFPMGTALLPHASSSFLIGSGFYRKQVMLDLSGEKRVFLTVGPAMWGCTVFCNGKLVGNVTGYSVSAEFEVTTFIRNNELNEIILVVCNLHDDGGAYCRLDGSHNGVPYGARPGQHRGLAAQGYQSERAGIGDHTFIRITGKSAIRDIWATFEKELPHWHAELVNGRGKTLHWTTLDGEKILDSGSFECDGDQVDFFSRKAPPRCWSDREPKLYSVRFELLDHNETQDRREQKWGARVLSCIGNRIAVNGNITYFRGVTEHCYFAETCNPHFDKAKYLRDLGVIRDAGFNFIRCHTWCPPEPFYEACDELGFFVQTELPSVYSFEEAAAIIRHIRRHPSAVIFCEGNEKLINDEVLDRMKKLAAMLRTMAPGMLFNPQEAMRMVEYEFNPNRVITQKPTPHDAARLADVAEFSDVYGSLGNGYFSYVHDEFPGPERADYEHSHYKKPCLSHEIGILGGYLNFELEPRYKGTFIGTNMFEAAREYMEKKCVYQNWKRYYENNCRFISSIRKQLVENLRSCNNITGYDYLGGIDTHWHLIGYPCGIFNEFYEEKFGETVEDVRRYNSESILLCSALRHRNRSARSRFEEKLLLSYFGCRTGKIRGNWSFETGNGKILAKGEFSKEGMEPGTIVKLTDFSFELPEFTIGEECILRAAGKLNEEIIENHWSFWVFPEEKAKETDLCRTAEKLTQELVEYASAGGAVLLTGGFPAETRTETFRPHTSGRSLGHSGALVNDHPVWKNFPHEGFMDWQFYPMMNGSTALVYDEKMPEFQPLMELIPSFKLIRRKSMLSEFRVGRGRIMMCGLILSDADPAGCFLKHEIVSYLVKHDFVPAPEWKPEELKKRLRQGLKTIREEIAVDAGGRPINL